MSLKVKLVKGKGRGVFTTSSIAKNKIIEVCELIIVKTKNVSMDIEPYVFQYSSASSALALGNGSLYNHNQEPNCEVTFDHNKKHLVFRSLTSIPAGSELTINYGYDEEMKKKFGIH